VELERRSAPWLMENGKGSKTARRPFSTASQSAGALKRISARADSKIARVDVKNTINARIVKVLGYGDYPAAARKRVAHQAGR
jgi:hypothetical protein